MRTNRIWTRLAGWAQRQTYGLNDIISNHVATKAAFSSCEHEIGRLRSDFEAVRMTDVNRG
jgi:macrodomain Ter protein organizer (MatP/YcbG family)